MSARALIASPLGFVVGLSLGALGAGGSILAVPMLVHVAGATPKDATAISLAVVAIAAIVGTLRHRRAGRVRARTGVTFGFAGVGGSIAGSVIARGIDGDLLMLGFAGLMLAAAWRMGSARPGRTDEGEERSPIAPSRSAAGRGPVRGLAIVGAGTLVGLLTGLFGVGGGFIVVPALVLLLGEPMPVAVGTSLLVIAINACVALVARIVHGGVPWGTALAFAAAATAGVVAGERVADRLDARALQRGFALLLVVLALTTGTVAALELT